METQLYVPIVFLFPSHAAVNNIKQLKFTTETQQGDRFSLVSSYKVFCPAVNNINMLSS